MQFILCDLHLNEKKLQMSYIVLVNFSDIDNYSIQELLYTTDDSQSPI